MTVTQYVWDQDNILYETDGNDAVNAEYTYSPEQYGELISEYRDGTTYTHYYDAQGSTLAMTDEAGHVTDRFTYNAWGEEVDRTGTTDTPWKWNSQYGYYWVEIISTFQIRHRCYRPTIGRWTTKDPFLLRRQWNRYVYSLNSPISFIDPSGLFLIPIHVELTEAAVDDWISVRFVSSECGTQLKQVIVCCNLAQDLTAEGFSRNERHYNREFFRDEDTAELIRYQPPLNIDAAAASRRRLSRGSDWDARYSQYLQDQMTAFRTAVQQVKCCDALRAIGRLSHSWQDFFGHAVRRDQGGATQVLNLRDGDFRNGRLGSETSHWPGFSAFADGDSLRGDPENRSGFMPSSYQLAEDGEHPQGNEPLTAGSAEYNARYQAARQFSARRIGDLLDDWHSACRSCCPVPKCPPCGLGRIYRLFAQGVPAYCPNE